MRQSFDRNIRLDTDDLVGDDYSGTARHGPSKRAMPGVEHEIVELRRADHRRTIRRHWPQAAPEMRALHIATFGEQITQRTVERQAAFRPQFHLIAADLGGAADANPVTEPCDRNLVSLIHHG